MGTRTPRNRADLSDEVQRLVFGKVLENGEDVRGEPASAEYIDNRRGQKLYRR
jgi:hypothetical protein